MVNINHLESEEAHDFFHFCFVSQTVRGGGGHGQSDGRHGADEPLHQPAGQESACQSQRWDARPTNAALDKAESPRPQNT